MLLNSAKMTSIIQNKITSTYIRLLSNYHQHTKSTIAVAISLASLVALGPSAYRDYKTFMSYGPGGVPYNAFGWLVAAVVLRPMTSDVLSTNVYEGQEDKGTWLPESVAQRKGERPIVGPHAAPQRQLNQFPGKEVQEVSFFSIGFRSHISLG